MYLRIRLSTIIRQGRLRHGTTFHYLRLPKGSIQIILRCKRCRLVTFQRRHFTRQYDRRVCTLNYTTHRSCLFYLQHISGLTRNLTYHFIRINNTLQRVICTTIRVNINIRVLFTRNIRRTRQLLHNDSIIRVSRQAIMSNTQGS